MKLSNTNQRRVILEELRMLHTHPTAEEMFAAVRLRLPKISLATVYRNLDLLADAGLIQRLQVTGKLKRYDGNMEPHYHVYCRKCGRIEDISLPVQETVSGELKRFCAEKKLSVKIEFEGLCGNCLATNAV